MSDIKQYGIISIEKLRKELEGISMNILPSSWEPISNKKVSKDIHSICYSKAHNTYIAGTTEGSIIYSRDKGISWYTKSISGLSGVIYTVYAAKEGQLLLAGDYYGKMAYSYNGLNWQVITSKLFSTSSSIPITSVCYGNGIFLACNFDGYTSISKDGISWNSATTLNSSTFSICYGNGKFLIGGSNGTIYSSVDGRTWSSDTPEAFKDTTDGSSYRYPIYSICYGNGKFIACGGYGVMAYSTDGVNWVPITSVELGTINSTCYGDGKFVACGPRTIVYSIDGINWEYADTPLVSANIKGINSVCYGNNQFILGGIPSNGSNGISMAYSDIDVTSTSSLKQFSIIPHDNSVIQNLLAYL